MGLVVAVGLVLWFGGFGGVADLVGLVGFVVWLVWLVLWFNDLVG